MSSLVLMDGGLVEVGDLLRSLPTRADFKVLVAELKYELRGETQKIHTEVTALQDRVDETAAQTVAVTTRVSAV